MTEPPAFDDDDTGKLGRLAREKDPSDPGGAIRGLTVQLLAHEQSDSRRWRAVAWAAGLALPALVSCAAYVAAQQQSAIEERADIRTSVSEARAEQSASQRQLDHIEQQLDRLIERSAP